MLLFNQDEKTQIIHVKASGVVDVQDFLDLIPRMEEKYPNLVSAKILLDYRQTTFQFTKSFETLELMEILELAQRHVQHYEFVKVGVIISNPTDKSFNLLYKKMAANIDNYYFEVFDTDKACMDWLKLSV